MNNIKRKKKKTKKITQESSNCLNNIPLCLDLSRTATQSQTRTHTVFMIKNGKKCFGLKKHAACCLGARSWLRQLAALVFRTWHGLKINWKASVRNQQQVECPCWYHRRGRQTTRKFNTNTHTHTHTYTQAHCEVEETRIVTVGYAPGASFRTLAEKKPSLARGTAAAAAVAVAASVAVAVDVLAKQHWYRRNSLNK